MSLGKYFNHILSDKTIVHNMEVHFSLSAVNIKLSGIPAENYETVLQK